MDIEDFIFIKNRLIFLEFIEELIKKKKIIFCFVVFVFCEEKICVNLFYGYLYKYVVSMLYLIKV